MSACHHDTFAAVYLSDEALLASAFAKSTFRADMVGERNALDSMDQPTRQGQRSLHCDVHLIVASEYGEIVSGGAG